MAKKVFLSFYYDEDVRRVSQVKQMGALDEQPLLSANDWEKVESGSDDAIKRWIHEQMKDKICNIVLIGTNTYRRPWVKYEASYAWNNGLAVMGIHIHNLKDPITGKSAKGLNPFTGINITHNGITRPFDNVPLIFDPDPNYAYNNIDESIEGWIDLAVAHRKKW